LVLWEKTSRMATLLSAGAACMMALVVEIYHADSLPPGGSIPRYTHTQAFVAACAGFLPAFLFLQRPNSGSWMQAFRLTAPWLILLVDVAVTLIAHLRWFWSLGIAIPLGVVAYRFMVRIAREDAKTKSAGR
jgi:hypothetical protein